MKIPVLGRHWPDLAAILMLPLLGCAGMLAGGCSRAQSSINLRFVLDDAGRKNSDGSAEVVVRNLQFYVHDVALRGADGRWRELKLANAGRWQSDRVALIDLAGSAGAERSAALHGALAEGGSQRYSAVRFTLGVPFDLNHANPLTAAAPLDRGELFWSWQLGYKFLARGSRGRRARMVLSPRQHRMCVRVERAAAVGAMRATQPYPRADRRHRSLADADPRPARRARDCNADGGACDLHRRLCADARVCGDICEDRTERRDRHVS